MICPSSIAAYLCGKKYKVKTCKVEVAKRTTYNVLVPDISEDPDLLTEWLGAFNLGCVL